MNPKNLNLRNLLYVPFIVAGAVIVCDRGYPEGIEKKLEPVKAKFEKACETGETGELGDYTKERDKLLKELGCEPGCLGWLCSIDHYGAKGKIYHEASEIKKWGCGCR